MGFVKKWFGFNGWKVMSTQKSIAATVFYRICFAIGLAMAIISYTFVSGGDDPSILWIAVVGLVWFLFFQFLINLIFVNSS